MASISCQHIYKIYPGATAPSVTDFNLEIQDKEFIIFVGPSGCGKSTTLRMIAGLEEISKGEMYIGGRLINDVPPKDRDIAMVFQSYALYPHMTVYKNIAFGLELRKTPKDEIDKRVHEAAKILEIEHLLDRKPKALSGGQRQRVALGRAMVRNPAVFLLDEPLSNLDAKLRTSMRTEIIKLHKKLATTFIYVTHDQTEAMTMGDRIVVMKDGIIQQVDTPQNLYDMPCNMFVAGFIGSPQMNFLDGTVTKNGDQYAIDLGGDTIPLPKEKTADGKKVDNTTADAEIANKTDVVLTSVAGNEKAIGYISLGALNDTVKAVKVDGAEATVDNVKAGAYQLSRPFNIATKGEPTGVAKDFISFILSKEGQAVVTDNKYIAVNDAAESFVSDGSSGQIAVGGSSSVSPVMEKLIEAYKAVNPKADIELQTTDSTTGMTAAIDGTYDIGMASRELKDSETEEGLTATKIAMDGIAVIVNQENPVEDLSSDTVKGIFTGETTTWDAAN